MSYVCAKTVAKMSCSSSFTYSYIARFFWFVCYSFVCSHFIFLKLFIYLLCCMLQVDAGSIGIPEGIQEVSVMMHFTYTYNYDHKVVVI